jgi:cell wall-associated NlpC family hydrolase
VPAPRLAARQTDYPQLAGFETRSVDGLGDMSPVAANAYLNAERWAQSNLPECALDASFQAGIGEVESAHGTTGGVRLLPGGDTSAPIGDALGARGPMHLSPSQWTGHATDGNGDGVSSPDNMYDATVVTARLLCELARELPETGGTLASPAARLRVAFAFDQGAAAPYVVDANDANHADDRAAEAVRFADSITAKLHSYGGVLEGTDRRIAEVVTWIRQQIQVGARYAATNPGRFGTPWDGVAKRSFISGRMYQYPAGTITFDCSGLMVVGFRQVGVDLLKLGADWTGGMLAKLPAVPRDQMRTGDLIILGSGGRTTHVVMYLGQGRDGEDRYIHAGSCGGTMGVCEREGIDWSRVLGVVRVPLPSTPDAP